MGENEFCNSSTLQLVPVEHETTISKSLFVCHVTLLALLCISLKFHFFHIAEYVNESMAIG